MFREMRRNDKQLSNEETFDVLRRGDIGYLSTVCENGYPYAIPLNFIYYNDSIYIHSAKEGQKVDNMKSCTKVSFSVSCDVVNLSDKFDTNYKSVILFGRAEEIFDNEKEEALLEIIKKYSPDYVEQGVKYIGKAKAATKVFKINIEHITGKAQI